MQASLDLLRRAGAERLVFITSLDEVQAEGDRNGFFKIEEVGQEMDAIIDAAERRRA